MGGRWFVSDGSVCLFGGPLCAADDFNTT
ncbi:unnamed protein product [Phytomonas sp. EM1]|nr:unnamed protein product [Phytomonas sp. EM1]|eukprot:CCW62160.1 unnamed protein product [Phytomonas sp. isolate EM1]